MDCCCWEGRGGVRNGGETKVDRVLDTDHLREEHGLWLVRWEGGVRNGGETKVDRVLDTDHSREEHGLLLLGREGRGKEWGRDKS